MAAHLRCTVLRYTELGLAAVLAALALRAPALAVQEPSGAGAALAAAERSPAKALERVVVLGASMAAGFGTRVDLAGALEACLAAEHEPVLGLGQTLFFTAPLSMGARAVQEALDAEPTLVVAIDFLFWFGYGALDRDGKALEREAQRLELLERGLDFLEGFECPLVLGDFPDMSAAVGRMLAPSQMPEPETLTQLSARVRAWAEERGDTIVLPLAEIARQLGSSEGVRIGRHAFEPGTPLLQADRLHPTTTGLLAITQLVCDELVRHGLARETDLVLDLAAVRARVEPEAPVKSSGGGK